MRKKKGKSNLFGYLIGIFVGIITLAFLALILSAVTMFLGDIFTAIIVPGAEWVYNTLSAVLLKFSIPIFMMIIFMMGLVCADGIVKENNSRS